MSEYVVICSSCGAENTEWDVENDTYWFSCVDCGYDNEQRMAWK